MSRPWDEEHTEVIRLQGTDPESGFQRGEISLRVHARRVCAGEHCCIHNPSDHPLRNAPLNWRADRGLMERICRHGVGHPDPDALAYEQARDPEYFEAMARGVHGCCEERCCLPGGAL